MKKLTNDQLVSISSDFGLETKVVQTVFNVESSGSGFDDKTGLIKIQFEPTKFSEQLTLKGISNIITATTENINGKMIQEYIVKVGTKIIQNGVQGQLTEWEALRHAKEINEEVALLATSWGLGQIMGFNFKSAGYDSVEAMIDSFEESEENQLRGMLKFILSNKPMFTALQEKNWSIFASHYNGTSYKKFNYDIRLKGAYDKL